MKYSIFVKNRQGAQDGAVRKTKTGVLNYIKSWHDLQNLSITVFIGDTNRVIVDKPYGTKRISWLY